MTQLKGLPKVEGFCLESFVHQLLADLRTTELYETCERERFAVDYLSAECLRKLPRGSSENRKAVAIQEFLDCERKNRETNRRLRADTPDHFRSSVKTIRSKVRDLLGPLNTNVVNTVLDKAYLGPGVSLDTRSPLVDKMASYWSCTPGLLPYALSIIQQDTQLLSRVAADTTYPCTALKYMAVVDYAKVTTVPKDSVKDRTISVEPMLNSWVQGGINRYLMARLKRFGIDLSDQTINRDLSGLAVKLGLATVDVKNASNTLTVGLFHRLVPKEWFKLLSLVRSSHYRLNKEYHKYELFSGMGNGITFPLESVLFYSIAYTACLESGCPPAVHVYGDDIIIPVGAYARLCVLFEYFGLEVNQKKSHATGEFRESCGAHWYKGHYCTPFYIKEWSSEISDVVKLHNQIWIWASRDGLIFNKAVIPHLRQLRQVTVNSLKRVARPGKVLRLIGVTDPMLGDRGFFPCSHIRPQVGYYLNAISVKKSYKGRIGGNVNLYRSLPTIGLDDNPTLGKYSERCESVQYRLKRGSTDWVSFPYVLI